MNSESIKEEYDDILNAKSQYIEGIQNKLEEITFDIDHLKTALSSFKVLFYPWGLDACIYFQDFSRRCILLSFICVEAGVSNPQYNFFIDNRIWFLMFPMSFSIIFLLQYWMKIAMIWHRNHVCLIYLYFCVFHINVTYCKWDDAKSILTWQDQKSNENEKLTLLENEVWLLYCTCFFQEVKLSIFAQWVWRLCRFSFSGLPQERTTLKFINWHSIHKKLRKG